jgi:hypothetical protein
MEQEADEQHAVTLQNGKENRPPISSRVSLMAHCNHKTDRPTNVSGQPKGGTRRSAQQSHRSSTVIRNSEGHIHPIIEGRILESASLQMLPRPDDGATDCHKPVATVPSCEIYADFSELRSSQRPLLLFILRF